MFGSWSLMLSWRRWCSNMLKRLPSDRSSMCEISYGTLCSLDISYLELFIVVESEIVKHAFLLQLIWLRLTGSLFSSASFRFGHYKTGRQLLGWSPSLLSIDSIWPVRLNSKSSASTFNWWKILIPPPPPTTAEAKNGCCRCARLYTTSLVLITILCWIAVK